VTKGEGYRIEEHKHSWLLQLSSSTYNYNSSGTGPLGAMNSNRAKVPGKEYIARKVFIPYQK
jgi:hypothetical protein